MLKRQNAEMTMFETLETELDKSSGIYANNIKFKAAVTSFKADKLINTNLAAATHTNLSGFSQEKSDQKIILASLASLLAGKAFVALSLLDKTGLAEQFHKEPTDYIGVADLECATLADNTIDLLTENLPDIKDGYVTEDDIVELRKVKAHFVELKGTSQQVQEVAPELRKAFDDSFAPVKKRISFILYLVRDFLKSDPAFYNRVVACSILPTIAVHHTSLIITLTDSATGQPVEGAEFELLKAKKKLLTDHNGTAEWYILRYGDDTLIGRLKGEIFYNQPIKVRKATLTQINLTVEVMKEGLKN